MEDEGKDLRKSQQSSRKNTRES